jgi:serine/threonine protein kinase
VRLYRPGNIVANRYEVQEVLGIGPVSAMYAVREQESQGLFALKVMNAELMISEAERELWVESIRQASESRHPHLRDIYEVESQGALVFYVGHYHPEGSLRSFLRAHPVMRFTEAEPLFSQICQALSEVALCHGGLRPENVLLSAGAVRVSELGLGTALPKGVYWSALRQEPARAYLAPELLQGGEATVASDLFALGSMLFELLVGQLHRAPEPIGLAKRLQLNESIDELLHRALSSSPSERYQSIEEFARQLRQVLRLTVFFSRSATREEVEPSQGLKSQERASALEPTLKPQVALKQPVRPAEPTKVIPPTTKVVEPPRPTELASKISTPLKSSDAKLIDRLSSPSISLRGLTPEPTIQRPTELKPPVKPAELPKPISKPPEAARSSESFSKSSTSMRPEPPRPGALASTRPATSEQELNSRATEPTSKTGFPAKASPAPEAPKNERISAAAKALSNEQDLSKGNMLEPKPPKPMPTAKALTANVDPEPTLVSAKVPEALAALIAAENAADTKAANGGFDPSLMLLRPFDASSRIPEPYLLHKTNPISKSALQELQQAPEPTLSNRLSEPTEAAPLQSPEPTTVFQKNLEPLQRDDPAFLETKMNKLPLPLPPKYPSIESVDLFVDIEEIEIEEEALNPFAEEPEKPKDKPSWLKLDPEDGEPTGIRPLPSRRPPSKPATHFKDLLDPAPPEPPPFEPPEEQS